MAIDGSTVVSALALIVSVISLLTSLQANRAATFEKRFELYRDVEKFVGCWMRDGQPDMREYYLVVDAWNRSHFLFHTRVTEYLNAMRLDAINAEMASRIVSGEIPGDRSQAIDRKYRLLKRYANTTATRAVFLPEMRLGARYGKAQLPRRAAKRFNYSLRKLFRSTIRFHKKSFRV